MKNFLKKFKKRWLEKLLSFIAAILLWLYVNEQNLPERYITLNLNLKNMPENLTIASPYKNEVIIKIKGKETYIATILNKDFEAFVDLKYSVVGKNVLPVTILKKTKSKFKIIKIEPEFIEIELDKVEHKKVPVSATIINNPADGYKIVDEIVSAENIVIKGPKSIIDNMNLIRTKPIDIGGVTGSIYKEVEFELPNEFITPVDFKTAKVNITIIKNFKSKIYQNAKVNFINLSKDLKILNIENSYAEFKLYGPPLKLEDIENNKNDILFVDLSDIKTPGKYEKKINAKVSEDCQILYIKPSIIKLEIGGE